MSAAFPTRLSDNPSQRWLVLSLALNIFFVSVAGALLVRHYFMPQTAVRATIDRSIAARIERIAATLPQADAEIMRSTYRARAAAIAPRQEAYRRAQDQARQVLRTQPFSADAMRAAMSEARAARQTYDEALMELMTAAATAMSPEGRGKLAEWPPGQRNTGNAAR